MQNFKRVGGFMKRLVALVVFLVVGALFAFANETVNLLTGEYQPFCGASGDTMWCEIINSAFAKEGVTVAWQGSTQDREKAAVADGSSVAFLSGTLVVGQDEKPLFVMNENPLIYVSIVAFYTKGKYPAGLGLKSAGDLKGKNVGVVRGTGSVSVLQKADVSIDVANTADLLMKKLAAGRDDVAAVADLVGLYSLQQAYPDKLGDYKYELLYNSPIDLIFSKKNPDSVRIKGLYDAGISQIKKDGTFMSILAKYYPRGQINRNILPKDLQ
jgi:ABC-type amino acid transport substrate-binding protein